MSTKNIVSRHGIGIFRILSIAGILSKKRDILSFHSEVFRSTILIIFMVNHSLFRFNSIDLAINFFKYFIGIRRETAILNH